MQLSNWGLKNIPDLSTNGFNTELLDSEPSKLPCSLLFTASVTQMTPRSHLLHLYHMDPVDCKHFALFNRAVDLAHVMYRMGLLATLRSKQKKGDSLIYNSD